MLIMRGDPATVRLSTGADGLLMSYSWICGELPSVSLLLSAGNDATARLLPSTRTMRARQFVSPAGLTIGSTFVAVLNGTCPRVTGPLVLPLVAVMVIVSPADAGSDALNVPSALTGRFVTDALVLVSTSVMVGEPPVTAFVAPATTTVVAPLGVSEMRSVRITGAAFTCTSATPISFATYA